MKLNRIPKPILISTIIIIALVALWHFGSTWYFSLQIAGNIESYINQAQEFRQLLPEPSNESLDNSLEAKPPSPELAKKMWNFNDFLTNHPFLQYEADALSKLRRQYDRARNRDEQLRIGKQLSKFYLDFHGFHIELMGLYVQEQLPYEPGSNRLNIVRAFIHKYSQVLKEMDDPFLFKAFQEEEPEEDLDYLKAMQQYEEWLKTRDQEEEYYNALKESLQQRTNKGSK